MTEIPITGSNFLTREPVFSRDGFMLDIRSGRVSSLEEANGSMGFDRSVVTSRNSFGFVWMNKQQTTNNKK